MSGKAPLWAAGWKPTAAARGRFRLDSVPAGEQRLRVRHLGFRSRELSVQVPAGEILGLTIRLDPEPVVLDPLDVEVESELRIPQLAEEGFYYRRSLNFGHFFGPPYLTRWAGMRVRSLVERIPSLRVPSRRGRPVEYIENRRCPRGSLQTFYLDGNRVKPPLPNLAVTEIAAMEVYRGPLCRGPNPFRNLDWDDWGEISCSLSGVNRTGC